MSQEIVERENRIRDAGVRLRASFEAIAQGRSDYALAHFVVASHDTPARQWAQAVLELQVKVFNIARGQLELEKLGLDLADAERRSRSGFDRTRKQRARVEADGIRVSFEEAELARLGQVREAEALLRIIAAIEKQHGGPFTHDELEAGEAEYWSLRLRRQVYLAARGAVDPGNGEALLQTMTEPGEPRPALMADDELHARLGVDPAPAPVLPGRPHWIELLEATDPDADGKPIHLVLQRDDGTMAVWCGVAPEPGMRAARHSELDHTRRVCRDCVRKRAAAQ